MACRIQTAAPLGLRGIRHHAGRINLHRRERFHPPFYRSLPTPILRGRPCPFWSAGVLVASRAKRFLWNHQLGHQCVVAHLPQGTFPSGLGGGRPFRHRLHPSSLLPRGARRRGLGGPLEPYKPLSPRLGSCPRILCGRTVSLSFRDHQHAPRGLGWAPKVQSEAPTILLPLFTSGLSKPLLKGICRRRGWSRQGRTP